MLSITVLPLNVCEEYIPLSDIGRTMLAEGLFSLTAFVTTILYSASLSIYDSISSVSLSESAIISRDLPIITPSNSPLCGESYLLERKSHTA